MDREKIEKLIANNELDKAIQLLFRQESEYSYSRDGLNLISVRLKVLQDMFLQNLISKENFLVEKNRIGKMVLGFMADVRSIETSHSETDIARDFSEGFLIADQPTEAVSLVFDAEDFSPEEIAASISMLSDLYREIGGDGLKIEGIQILSEEEELIPTN